MNKTMIFILGCLPLFWSKLLGMTGWDLHIPVFEWFGFITTVAVWVFLSKLAVEKLNDKKQAILWLNVPSLALGAASAIAIVWVDTDLALAETFFAAVHGPLHYIWSPCNVTYVISSILLLLISVMTSKFIKTKA